MSNRDSGKPCHAIHCHKWKQACRAVSCKGSDRDIRNRGKPCPSSWILTRRAAEILITPCQTMSQNKTKTKRQAKCRLEDEHLFDMVMTRALLGSNCFYLLQAGSAVNALFLFKFSLICRFVPFVGR